MEFSEYYKSQDVADSYDKKRLGGIKAGTIRKIERWYIKNLLKDTKKNILEAGIGTGYITSILRELGEVEGFDISPVMISKAKKKFGDMKIIEADILNLKLNKKYDSMVSIRVISHFDLDGAEKALKNLSKFLKKGGYVVFNLENKSLLRKFLRKLRRWGSTKTYQYSESDIDALLGKVGLKLKDRIYNDHLFLYPFHLINKILMNSLEENIMKLELRLSNIKFASNNVILKCQK